MNVLSAHAVQPPRPVEGVPNELVPSRYALRVGEIDVLVISDGVLPLPFATMSTNVGPAERTAWLDNLFLPEKFDWAVRGTGGARRRRLPFRAGLLGLLSAS
jgi:hypothetical protein